MNETIRLTQLSAVILRQTGQHGPGHRALYRAAIDAKFPAELRGKAWIIRRSDIPAILSVFGLK